MNIHPLNDIDGYKEKQKPSEVLKYALGFSDEDLAANQAGKMSTNQRLRCLTKRNWWLFGCVLCILGFLVSWFGSRESLFFLVVFGVSIVVCLVNAYRYYKDARDGIASSVEGRINLQITSGRFSIVLDGGKFALKKQTFLAFKNGDPYCLYYSPHNKILLSAEWLRD